MFSQIQGLYAILSQVPCKMDTLKITNNAKLVKNTINTKERMERHKTGWTGLVRQGDALFLVVEFYRDTDNW